MTNTDLDAIRGKLANNQQWGEDAITALWSDGEIIPLLEHIAALTAERDALILIQAKIEEDNLRFAELVDQVDQKYGQAVAQLALCEQARDKDRVFITTQGEALSKELDRAEMAEAQVRHLTQQVTDLEIECIESDKQADQELIAQYQASEGWRKRAEAAEAQVRQLTQQLVIVRALVEECVPNGAATDLLAALAGVSAPPERDKE